MIASALAVLLLAAQAAPSPAATAQAEVRNAERAYNQCMNSQGNLDDANTGMGRAGNAALGMCRISLEAMLEAQRAWIEVADLSEAEKRQARRNLRSSVRALRDEALFPLRAPREFAD
jgi:uncharacterized protein YecT (DUF1311 family)